MTGVQFPAGTTMGFLSSPPHPHRIWDPTQSVAVVFTLRIKAAWAWSWPLTSI